MTTPFPDTATNLLFHLVDGEEAPAVGSPLLRVSASALSQRVEALLAAGLRPASLADYLGPEPPGPGAFTLSFDDAHPGVLEVAAPALAALGVPATVFVPTAHVGETDRVMTWAQLRELAALPGWTLGSHSERHDRMSWRLYREDRPAQLARLTAEGRRSRLTLEAHLSRPCSLFAYPFGDAPAVAREAVAAAGYGAAFIVADSPAWAGDLFALPRIDGNALAQPEVPPSISVIVPACDRLEILAEVVRRLAEQSYPPERYEVLVVDDGSRADLTRALAPLLAGHENLRVLSLEGRDQGFRAGQARQAGARAARFEALAFLDADVAVDQDFLWHLGYCHGLDDRAVVLGYLSGYNLHDLGHVHRLEDISREERLTGDRLPVIPDRGREPTLRGCLDDVQGLAEPWRLAYTGNLSVSRSLLEEAGGFSDEFRGWGFEDVDLGLRLHEAGSLWIFSRWALGYHLVDEAELGPAGEAPRNPFRDPTPDPERFAPVLTNLDTLEGRHRGHRGVAGFCAQVRADAAEICDPPRVVGVELGAPSPLVWPFSARAHHRWPGGLPVEEIFERLAYAARLGARALYLLGGDGALRPELLEILERAVALGLGEEITLETTAIPFAEGDLAVEAARRGLGAAVIEVLAGGGHPERDEAVRAGCEALRAAGVRLSAKLILGEDDQVAFNEGRTWIGDMALPLEQVMVLDARAARWVRAVVGHDLEVEVWDAAADQSEATT